MGPLIDVVFLLLIFFMLVGTFMPPEPGKINPPASESGVTPVGSNLVVFLAADGRLAFEGRELGRRALARILAQRMAEGAEPTVQLKADAARPAHEVITVLDTLRGAGIGDLVLLTVAEDAP